MSDEEKLLTSENSTNKQTPKQKLLNNLITSSKIIISFSVPHSKVNNLLDFLEISHREDKNKSITINKALEEYVKHHHIPNPQAQLDRLIQLGLPHKAKWQCCVPECKNKAQHEVMLANFEGLTETFRVCSTHLRWKHAEYKVLRASKKL